MNAIQQRLQGLANVFDLFRILTVANFDKLTMMWSQSMDFRKFCRRRSGSQRCALRGLPSRKPHGRVGIGPAGDALEVMSIFKKTGENQL
jgi:hypothetical protein